MDPASQVQQGFPCCSVVCESKFAAELGLTYRSAISVDESSKLGHQGAKKVVPNGSTMGGLYYEGNCSLEHAGEANNMSHLIQVRYFLEHRRGEFTAFVERRDSHDAPCKNE